MTIIKYQKQKKVLEKAQGISYAVQTDNLFINHKKYETACLN